MASGRLEDVFQEVEIVEHHFHGRARWLGSTAGDAPGLLSSITPWVLVSGASANEYGAAKLIFDGTEDFDVTFTPLYIDPHQVFVLDTSSDDKTWKMQVATSGWDGANHTYASMAEAVAAGAYSEVIVRLDSFKSTSTPVEVQTPRARVGSYVWARVLNSEAAPSTISVVIGLHAYAE